MHSHLLNRSTGLLGAKALQQAETSRLLYALQSAPGVRFDGSDSASTQHNHRRGNGESVASAGLWAQRAGVNCLAIDKFEGR